jgi:hypothetical protein
METQDVLQEIEKIIKDKEAEYNSYYSTDSLPNKLLHVLQSAETGSQTAIADKRKLIEDALVYFRSVVMIVESIGMAGTHAEKSARLRGLIELLYSAIGKLRNDQQDSLLQNWESFSWSYSDYPYRKVLENYKDLQRQNEQMKSVLEKNNIKDDLPF